MHMFSFDIIYAKKIDKTTCVFKRDCPNIHSSQQCVILFIEHLLCARHHVSALHMLFYLIFTTQ